MLQKQAQIGSHFDEIINKLIDEDIRFSEVPMELQKVWKDGDLDDLRDEEAEVFHYYDDCPDF